jgi:iron-sulfur cluster assembly accessory protein
MKERRQMIETQPAISFTDGAVAKLREILAKQGSPDLAVRVRVTSGGCSGLSYDMGLEPPVAQPGDELFETNGVKVLLDAGSRPHVEGSVIDWQGSTLGSGGFKFNNPNAAGACGCGESFTTKKKPAAESFDV